MRPRVIIFNCPMRNGKDAAVDEMILRFGEGNVNRISFKDQLILATANTLSISVEEFLEGYDDKVSDRERKYEQWLGQSTGVEWWKDTPIYDIGGKLYSKRTALIHISENVMKPLIGDDVFGVATVKSLVSSKLNLIPDSGFDAEVKPLLEVADVLILKRDRLRTGWGNLDSRGWVEDSLGTQIWCPEDITELELTGSIGLRNK